MTFWQNIRGCCCAAVLFSGCGVSGPVVDADSSSHEHDASAIVLPTAESSASRVDRPTRSIATSDAATFANMFAAPVQETVDEPFNEPMAPPEEPLTPKRRSSVQLMGFVDVDHPMALLNVAGEIEMLSVGDVCCDIRVTAIEPPTVRIQRLPGSHDAEETISLFDRTWDEAAVWANPHPGKHASPPRRQSASVSSTVAGDTSLTRVPRSTAPIDLVEMITTPVVTAAPLPVIEAIPGLALPGMTVFERDAAGGK